MRQVSVTRTLADAYLVADFLTAQGLRPEIRNEHLVGTQGGLPLTSDTLPTIWVADEEAAQAADLLRRQDEAGGFAATAALDDPADPGADPAAHEAMAELYPVVDRLRRRVDGAQVDAARDLVATISGSAAPYGIDPEVWRDIGERGTRLVARADAADDEAVLTEAAELRDLLRPLV